MEPHSAIAINLLIVVKQKPLFNVIKHLLSSAMGIGVISHARTMASVQAGIKSGRLALHYDALLLDVTAAEQQCAVALLRSVWPQAKLIRLAYDRKLIMPQQPPFDAVVMKSALVKELPACLGRLQRVLAK